MFDFVKSFKLKEKIQLFKKGLCQKKSRITFEKKIRNDIFSKIMHNMKNLNSSHKVHKVKHKFVTGVATYS